jgi:hypothetical protein
MQTLRHSSCHCTGSIAPDFSRRGFLQRTSAGFGWLALSSLFSRTASAAPGAHFAAKAKNIIFCFMDGGPSHVDTFDPKPMLKQHEGKAIGASAVSKRAQANANRVCLAARGSSSSAGRAACG